MFKIKFDNHFGTGLFFVVETKTSEEAKKRFYEEMLITDRIKQDPKKTTKKFVEGLKKRSENYWIRFY